MFDSTKPQLKRLSDLVDQVDDKIAIKKDPNLPYVGLEHIGQRNAHLLGWAPSETSVSVNSVFQEADVLFGKLRPNLRKCVSAPFAGYCSTDIIVLRARNGNDPKFAARVFQTDAVGAEAERTSVGTKMPRTSWKSLSQFLVPIPEPVAQSKIAEILDTLDAAIQGTEAVVAKLKAMKQGLLHDLLTRGIDANGDLRPPQTEASHLYKQTPLGWLPKEWDVRTLEELCSNIVDCPHTTPVFRDHGVYVARTMHIKDGQYLQNIASFVSESEYSERIARLEPQPGDVIFTREAPVGQAFCIPEGMKICLGQRVMLFRPKPARLISQYLIAHIYSGAVQNAISLKTAGTTNPHLNVADVRVLKVPAPSVGEQEIISSGLAEIDQKLKDENHLLEKLRLQKSGLMDDLLTGKAPVTALL